MGQRIHSTSAATSAKQPRRSTVTHAADERHDELSPARAPSALGVLSAQNLLSLQRHAGNQAVLRLIAASTGTIMREFEDDDKVAEDAVGVARGFAPETRLAKPVAPRVNESGLFDGEIGSGVEPHAFSDKGKTGNANWIHTGGTGGAGNESTGEATLVAPVIKTKPPKKQGGRASAWVQNGTGKIKVKRSFTGVTYGINGQTTSGNAGNLWMSPRAQDRIDKHERKHVKSSKEIHEQYVEPLEARVSRFSGLIKANKHGTDEQAAEQALITRLDWNQSIQDFKDADTTANQPSGTTDTNDTSDFYADYATKPSFQKKTGATIYEGVGASRRKKSAKQKM
jgi:hypothetical protein